MSEKTLDTFIVLYPERAIKAAREKVEESFTEKGNSWKTESPQYLAQKIRENLDDVFESPVTVWRDNALLNVINYAAMLYERLEEK